MMQKFRSWDNKERKMADIQKLKILKFESLNEKYPLGGANLST